VIPPIDCQRVLAAIPTEMAPYLAGYKVKGTFDTDVHIDIDWNDLDSTQLDGHIGIKHCKVVDEPADSPRRLAQEGTERPTSPVAAAIPTFLSETLRLST